MGKNGQSMEAIVVRRAALADADKVRYRVYRTADDFIAVIAESALMAVKVAGVTEPYRIVRDLPTEGVTIKAERLAKQESADPRVSLALERKDKMISVSGLPEGEQRADFVPMQLRDLQKNKTRHLRVLSPEDLAALLARQPELPPAPAPPPPMEAASIAEPEPPPLPIDNDKPLSPEEVARLLGQ